MLWNGQKILIADDNELLRQTLGEFFSLYGFQVLEAPDGDTALDLALHNHPFFSILDFHMPGMDGRQVLSALLNHGFPCLQDEGRPVLPCILISAAATPEEIKSAFDKGAFRFLNKPLSPKDLLTAVQALEQRFQAEQSAEEPQALLPPFQGWGGCSGLPVPALGPQLPIPSPSSFPEANFEELIALLRKCRKAGERKEEEGKEGKQRDKR
ncbi:MAG TPA: response regulator [Planctomycetes bacterium]|nr:response regulator [Planctomycetota bacterium]